MQISLLGVAIEVEKEVRMGSIQEELSIFNKFNFDKPPVGVKFLPNKPEGMERLDKILDFCEMLPEAQGGSAFYVTKENFTCVGPLILGMIEHEPIFESGQVGPKLEVLKDIRANQRIYHVIPKLQKGVVNYVAFAQVQLRLAARAPQVIHPREVDSPYLLSGIMHCGVCGAAMVGQRSGHCYRYYMCGNARRKGREVCPSPLLPKGRVEGFIIDRIKSYILTEENLEELVRLTNEELCQSCSENRERLELIQAHIEEIDSRLSKLYDAIETGEFKGGELASRIKVLSQRKEELLQAKADAEEILRYESVDMADPQVVQDYVDDLRSLLAKSSITEQRSFLKSFIERIEVDESEAKVYYTIPMPPHSVSEETVGVLPFVHHG
jgi:hypothetical protein